ncbi:MAG: 16S rRNA (guanine(966)-N(2))-methyltransferase RsmD [Candidatus Cloacimonetes bacterium]|nr:16S rRNA (guanine(966)-N(2))-methyltransferase RsmD [Candidatus Cloacimonadota bacterium]
MRIIAGEWKGAKLFSVQNKRTRPTTDYLKEVIFSVLYDVAEAQVLDLFAGSGGLGLEALSRGARHVTFVDIDEKALTSIHRSIDKIRCSEQCSLFRKKASAFLAANEHTYDLILMDPPYDRRLVNKTLRQVFEHGRLAPGGRLLVEHAAAELLDERWAPVYQKRFGDSVISIIKLEEK